jgi:hypothetical protein
VWDRDPGELPSNPLNETFDDDSEAMSEDADREMFGDEVTDYGLGDIGNK